MAGWTKIEVFDYARLIHTFAAGADRLSFEHAGLSRGVHAVSAQLTIGNKTYASFPQTFLVTPPR